MISDVTPAPCPEPEPIFDRSFADEPPACVAAIIADGDFTFAPDIWAGAVIQGGEAVQTRQSCIKDVSKWIASERKARNTEGADQ